MGFVEIHGEVITGMQGIGVRTPIAAAVAVATIGFVIVLHIPKGLIFSKGAKSHIVAKGKPAIKEVLGRTERTDGAFPKEHFKQAPHTTIGT